VRVRTEVSHARLEDRARRSLSHMPRPFVRWAGSKRALLQHLIPHVPGTFGTYYEPFLGSGALFLLLQPKRARLSDTCRELISTWQAVALDAAAVADAAQSRPLSKHYYYEVRANRSTDPISAAGEFLYLNRGCFNGLYRVNSRGEFNVPWGAPKTGFIIDGDNLRAVKQLLDSVDADISCTDFESSLSRAASGDLAYLDPPYVTKHNNNGFIDYNKKLFSWADQIRLAATAESLRSRGVHVLVSNANHPEIVVLYPNFKAISFERSSTLASAKSKRGRVSEVLLIGME
jgi:DNA adenine methylase